MAAASATGAVFFLGTRAHYQVLQQPSCQSQSDIDNGNAADTYKCHDGIDDPDDDKLDIGTGMKRRARRASETTLCEKDDMNPTLLNNRNDDTPKKPRRRGNVLSYFQSFGRRKQGDSDQQMHSFDGVLLNCSYRESCRCLECQSSYFDCDESDDDYNSSEESERDYNLDYDYPPRYTSQEICDEDDEVFVTSGPGDNTSNDLLIDGHAEGQPAVTKMSISSDEVDSDELQLEVAAGTPVVLNYLLTHPITCSIQ